MKVYYLAPQKDFSVHKDMYIDTIKAIKNHGGIIVDDWFASYRRLDNDDAFVSDSSKYYQEAMKQITDSDIVIFDATVSSMSIGHQMTYALYLQKPTLLLINEEFRKREDLFIAGSESPLLTIKSYRTASDIDKYIEGYMNSNQLNKKNRLNLALDRQQSEYLAWASYYYKRTKTALVKQSIDKMLYSDDEYRISRNSKI